jgi:hypothetical protein
MHRSFEQLRHHRAIALCYLRSAAPRVGQSCGPLRPSAQHLARVSQQKLLGDNLRNKAQPLWRLASMKHQTSAGSADLCGPPASGENLSGKLGLRGEHRPPRNLCDKRAHGIVKLLERPMMPPLLNVISRMQPFEGHASFLICITLIHEPSMVCCKNENLDFNHLISFICHTSSYN